jgi:hypothetical protein
MGLYWGPMRVATVAALVVALPMGAAGQTVIRVAPTFAANALVWNIADRDGYPNILSELEWTGLFVVGIEAQVDGSLDCRVELRGLARAGWIVHGENRDSDYDDNDRQQEWSRSVNDGSGGLVWALSVAAGYRLDLGPVRLVPLCGLAATQERLRMTEGRQVVSVASGAHGPPPTGPFDDELDSRYVATWGGPWVGFEVGMHMRHNLAVLVSAGYHVTLYYAWADWNLRDDLDHPRSFEHRAWGQAMSAAAEGSLRLDARRAIVVRGDLEFGAVGPGGDRTFAPDGAVGYTQLNGVWWCSICASAGLRLRL